jgi:hypothetical protein
MKDKMHSFPRFVSDAKGPHVAMSELFLQKNCKWNKNSIASLAYNAEKIAGDGRVDSGGRPELIDDLPHS